MAPARAGAGLEALTAAVNRDRQVQQDIVALREGLLEPCQNEAGTRRGRQEASLDLGERRQLRQLGLESAGKPPAAEIPAVELPQEPGGAVLSELADRLAHEQDQFGDDLLARGLGCVPLEDLPQRPWVPLGGAADHD